MGSEYFSHHDCTTSNKVSNINETIVVICQTFFKNWRSIMMINGNFDKILWRNKNGAGAINNDFVKSNICQTADINALVTLDKSNG